MNVRINEPAENPSQPVSETKPQPKAKRKPCRICTLLDPTHEPTPHDPSRMHTDTNATDGAKKVK